MKAKLIWSTKNDANRKLILEDGRNLFDLIPIESVQFIGKINSQEIVLKISVIDDFSVEGRIELPYNILNDIAKGMGFTLVPTKPDWHKKL